MRRDGFKPNIAVIGCNKAANDYIAKAVARILGMKYMDLDGYLKYCLGGLTPSQALVAGGKDYLTDQMRACYAGAAEFEGVVISSSPLIFCTGADDITEACYTFMPQRERVDIRRIDVKLRKYMDVDEFNGNYIRANEMSLQLVGGVEDNVKAIIKFLEDEANGRV